jgi:hypothetical protein
MFEIITIDVTSYPPQGLGERQYKTHPRIGEWIELDIDHIGTMFQVVMVAHSAQGAGSDIYVKRLSETPQCIKSICEK